MNLVYEATAFGLLNYLHEEKMSVSAAKELIAQCIPDNPPALKDVSELPLTPPPNTTMAFGNNTIFIEIRYDTVDQGLLAAAIYGALYPEANNPKDFVDLVCKYFLKKDPKEFLDKAEMAQSEMMSKLRKETFH